MKIGIAIVHDSYDFRVALFSFTGTDPGHVGSVRMPPFKR
jgi:hypothetical protein